MGTGEAGSIRTAQRVSAATGSISTSKVEQQRSYSGQLGSSGQRKEPGSGAQGIWSTQPSSVKQIPSQAAAMAQKNAPVSHTRAKSSSSLQSSSTAADLLRRASTSSKSLGSSARTGMPSIASRGLGSKVDASRILASRTGQLGRSADEIASKAKVQLTTPAQAAVDESSASVAPKPIRTSRPTGVSSKLGRSPGTSHLQRSISSSRTQSPALECMRVHGPGSARSNAQTASNQGSTYATSLKEQHSVPADNVSRSFSRDSSSSTSTTPPVAGSLSSAGSLGRPVSFEAASISPYPYRSESGSISAYLRESSSGEASKPSSCTTASAAGVAGPVAGLENRSSSGKLGSYGLDPDRYRPSTLPLDMGGNLGDVSRYAVSYSTYVATRTSLSRRSTDEDASLAVSAATPPPAVYAGQPTTAAPASTLVWNTAATVAPAGGGLSRASNKTAFNRAAVSSTLSGVPSARAGKEEQVSNSSSSQSNLDLPYQTRGTPAQARSAAVAEVDTIAAAAVEAPSGKPMPPFVAHSDGRGLGETPVTGTNPVGAWGVPTAASRAGSAGPAWYGRRSSDSGADGSASCAPSTLPPAAHTLPPRAARGEVTFTSTSTAANLLQPAATAAATEATASTSVISGRRSKQQGSTAAAAPGATSSGRSGGRGASRSSKSPTRRTGSLLPCMDPPQTAGSDDDEGLAPSRRSASQGSQQVLPLGQHQRHHQQQQLPMKDAGAIEADAGASGACLGSSSSQDGGLHMHANQVPPAAASIEGSSSEGLLQALHEQRQQKIADTETVPSVSFRAAAAAAAAGAAAISHLSGAGALGSNSSSSDGSSPSKCRSKKGPVASSVKAGGSSSSSGSTSGSASGSPFLQKLVNQIKGHSKSGSSGSSKSGSKKQGAEVTPSRGTQDEGVASASGSPMLSATGEGEAAFHAGGGAGGTAAVTLASSDLMLSGVPGQRCLEPIQQQGTYCEQQQQHPHQQQYGQPVRPNRSSGGGVAGSLGALADGLPSVDAAMHRHGILSEGGNFYHSASGSCSTRVSSSAGCSSSYETPAGSPSHGARVSGLDGTSRGSWGGSGLAGRLPAGGDEAAGHHPSQQASRSRSGAMEDRASILPPLASAGRQQSFLISTAVEEDEGNEGANGSLWDSSSGSDGGYMAGASNLASPDHTLPGAVASSLASHSHALQQLKQQQQQRHQQQQQRDPQAGSMNLQRRQTVSDDSEYKQNTANCSQAQAIYDTTDVDSDVSELTCSSPSASSSSSTGDSPPARRGGVATNGVAAMHLNHRRHCSVTSLSTDSAEAEDVHHHQQQQGGAGTLEQGGVLRGSKRAQGCVGLVNLGNTCFMNSILQCLNCVPDFVNQMTSSGRGAIAWHASTRGGSSNRDEEQSEVKQQQQGRGLLTRMGPGAVAAPRPPSGVGPSLAALLVEMWNSGAAPYVNPRGLLRALALKDDRWGEGMQQDSQEFLHSLLELLQAECNRVVTKPVYKELTGKGTEAEQAAEAATYARSWCDSLVDDIFGGQLQSTLTCNACGWQSHCFDPCLDLSVPIPKKHPVSLEDCLAAFVEQETLGGSEQIKCGGCKTLQPATKKLQIYDFPKLLILTLKRFNSSGAGCMGGYFSPYCKNSTPVEISEFLDLATYCNPSGAKEAVSRGKYPPVYRLIAVSHHSGCMGGGHYTAQGRFAKDGSWWGFNDDDVTRERGPPVGASSSAYVLFYQLMPPKML